MATPGETDTSHGKVQTGVKATVVVLSHIHIIKTTIQVRQTIIGVGAEGVYQVL